MPFSNNVKLVALAAFAVGVFSCTSVIVKPMCQSLSGDGPSSGDSPDDTFFGNRKLTLPEFVQEYHEKYGIDPLQNMDMDYGCLLKNIVGKMTFAELQNRLRAVEGKCALPVPGRRLKSSTPRICITTWMITGVASDAFTRFLYVLAIGASIALCFSAAYLMYASNSKFAKIIVLGASAAVCACDSAFLVRLATHYEAFKSFGPGLSMLIVSMLLSVASMLIVFKVPMPSHVAQKDADSNVVALSTQMRGLPSKVPTSRKF